MKKSFRINLKRMRRKKRINPKLNRGITQIIKDENTKRKKMKEKA